MKLVCISDTHNQHKNLSHLPDGDILLHAGDISGIGRREEVLDFINWTVKQAPRYTYGVVFIAGNHDRCFDPKFGEYAFEDKQKEGSKNKPKWLIDTLHDLKRDNIGVHYLENNWVELGGVKIWGSPITPWFHGDRWAFNKHRGLDIREVWDQIPLDTDIVITHGPVSYKLDYIPRTQEYVGCEDLRRTVEGVCPLMHISGHIHEGYGVEYNVHTTFINAATCNEFYEPNNKPWEVVLDLIDRETQIL